MPTSPPSITALPSAPDPNDRSTFNSRAYPWAAALPTFGTEVLAVGTNAYTNATQAATSATAAASSASAAASSATLATGAVATSGAVLWVSGTTYAIGNLVYSPLTLRSYRRRVAGAGSTDPSLDSTNWAEASAAPGLVPVGGLVPLPITSADLTTGPLGEKYLRTGVVDDSANWPLAPAETVPYLTATSQAIAPYNFARNSLTYGLGVFVRDVNGAAPSWSTDGMTWTTASLTPAGSYSGVAFDAIAGYFYLISGNGTTIYTYVSYDGKTWTQRASSAMATVPQGAVANNGTIVCSTQSNSIVLVSTDMGLSWTATSTNFSTSCAPSPPTYNATAGLFLVIGAGNATSSTSPDGITWTQRTLPFTAAASPQASSAGTRFWSSTSSQVYSSSDGITWSPVTVSGFSTPNGRFGLVLLGSTYVLVSGNGAWTSPDGITWLARTSPFQQSGAIPFHIACSPTLLLATCGQNAGDSGAPAYTSDGITWSWYGYDNSYSIAGTGFAVAGDGAGRFVSASTGYSAATLAAKSTDGLKWVSNNGLTGGGTWSVLMILNGLYIAHSAVAANTAVMTSSDAVTWTSCAVASAGASSWYTCGAYGSSSYILMPGNAASAQGQTSTNGTTWANVTVPSAAYTGVAYGAGKFVAVSTTAATAYCTGASSGTWTAGTCMAASGIVFVGSKFLVWSSSSAFNRTSTDGINWTLNRNPGDYTIMDCKLSGNGKAYILTSNRVYSTTDGTTWVFEFQAGSASKLLPTATGVICYSTNANGLLLEWKRHVRVANSVAQYPVKSSGGTPSATHQMFMRIA